jgi:hypothetical protein
MPRDFATDAALRPQLKRDGPDDWPTPACLLAALVHDVLPTLPPGPVWEPAPGIGALADAITATGRSVVTTSDNFYSRAVPQRVRILVTNPPLHQHSALIQRGLYLPASHELHPATTSRPSSLFNGKAGNGRWSNAWVVWLRAVAPRRPVWLSRRIPLNRTEHSPAPERAGLVDRCEDRLAAAVVGNRHSART